MQTVRRRIEADVDRSRLCVQPLRQVVIVRGLMNEPTPSEIVKDVKIHEGTVKGQPVGAGGNKLSKADR